MQSKGFTLLELLFTLAIGAIILSLATPTLGSIITKYRLRAAAHDLLNDVQLARNEAVNRATRVTISNGDNHWHTGWTTFIDYNGDGTYDTGETVLYAREGYAADLSISGNSSVAAMISYVATGESKSANGAFQAGTVTFCSNAVDKLTKLIISSNGRPRLESSARSGNC